MVPDLAGGATALATGGDGDLVAGALAGHGSVLVSASAIPSGSIHGGGAGPRMDTVIPAIPTAASMAIPILDTTHRMTIQIRRHQKMINTINIIKTIRTIQATRMEIGRRQMGRVRPPRPIPGI